jgi:hypothetical protein
VQGVYRTIDGGTTWTKRSADVPTDCANANVQSWYNVGITVSPTVPETFYMSTVDAFRSIDGGATLVNMTCGYGGGNVHVDHHARAFVANDPNKLLLGSDGGVFFSSNPNVTTGRPTFINLNNTLATIEFYSGDITANFATSAATGALAGAQDNGSSLATWTSSPPVAKTWDSKLGGDGFFARLEPLLGQRWYMAQNSGTSTRVAASTTGPTGSFGTTVTPSAYDADRKSFIMPYEIYRYGGETTGCPAATGCGRMMLGTYRIWETVNGGIPSTTSWQINSPDLTRGTGPGNLADRSFINQISYAVNTPSNAMVGTNDGKVWMGFGMGQNLANSATWVDLTGSNTTLPMRPVMDVTFDPADPLIGYAAIGGFSQNSPGTPGHVYRVVCAASCATFVWTDASGNLPNIPVNSILVNPNRPTQVFAGSDWGLFFTDDVTATPVVWKRHAGLPSMMIWDMTIDRGFTTLAVWTRSRGAWVWPLPGGTGFNNDLLLQDGFESLGD